MCECGCGDFRIDRGFRLPDGTELTYRIYHGCQECFGGPGVDISVFTPGNPWTQDCDLVEFKPTEDGGTEADNKQARVGIPIALFEVQDLRSAAKEIEAKEGAEIGPGDEQYATLDDWLYDFGLEMVQVALRKFKERTKNLRSGK